MAKPFKEYFDAELVRELGSRLATADPEFDRAGFEREAVSRIGPLELKARVDAIAEEMRARLPDDWNAAASTLHSILGPENPDPEAGAFNFGYPLMPVARLVERFGIEQPEISMELVYEITKRHTSEFAIRPYLGRYPGPSLALLETWSTDPNSHVRRLVSEGTRPRLPWASRLTVFDEDPDPIYGLLERLNDDPSHYVRNSVANHLGDLLKGDEPGRAWETLERWARSEDVGTRWIVRHAIRKPRKDGVERALELTERAR